MKRVQISLLLLFIVCMELRATGFGQVKINLQLSGISIRSLLNAVEKQTAYRFVYHTGIFPEDKKIDMHVTNAGLEEVLNKAFSGLALDYTVKEDNLVVIYARKAGEPAWVIRGQVLSPERAPLAGVTVRVVGAEGAGGPGAGGSAGAGADAGGSGSGAVGAGAAGAVTDAAGRFQLALPEGAKALEFSLVGYQTRQVRIGEQAEILVTLELQVKNLGEVIVTGYTGYSRNTSAAAVTMVGGDKINEVPLASFEQSLQGRVPGLAVAAVSGQPGTSANVVLRGVGTITGSSSLLYVLDGVPIESDAFQAINPGDIESVTVLKDASAKALYGSRGSNGVIVITTRKGRAGRVTVNYTSQYGISKLTNSNYRMMNTSERKQFEEELGQESGVVAGPFWTYSKKNPAYAAMSPTDQAAADHIVDSLGKINTNWRNFFLRDGKFTEQQLSASGGNEAIRFYTSFNYFDQQGIVRTSGLKRYTLKNNLDFTAGRLTANMNLSLGYSQSDFIQREGSTNGRNPMAAIYYALPYEYPYAPDGKLVTTGDGATYPVLDRREGSNALEQMLNSTSRENQYKTIFSTSLNYRLAKGLSAKTRLGIDFSHRDSESWINPDSYAGSRVSTGSLGSLSEGFLQRFALVSTSGLTYNKVIHDDHELEVTGLFEFLRNTYKSFGYTGYGLDARLPQTPAGIGDPATYTPDLNGSKTQNATSSWIGLLRYTFRNKYTLNGSYRYDGSSVLPEKNRWHGFYSAGVSWEAKKENFLANVGWLAGLRARSSYGTTASRFVSDFAYLPTYGRASYGGNPGIVPVAPGNPDYNWEYAREFNIGFDLALLKSNRIRLTAEYYNRITYNLFFPRVVSATAGIPGTDSNDPNTIPLSSGKMRNRGVEIDLQGDIIKQKDLVWTIGGNMAFNKNVVLDLGGYNEFEYGNTGIIRVGEAFGAHYAPKWAGVDPATGDPQYYDKQGKITKNYDATALSVTGLGSYIPQLTGGFTTGLKWKDFYLNALFTWTAKVMRYNHEDYYNENPSFVTSNQSTRMLYNRWKKQGDNAILPRIDATRSFTSRDIQDASYVRFRNINVGYHLPRSVASGLKFIQGLQIYVQAENLYTWTKWRGFDPENGNEYANYGYPAPRIYTVGLNANF